VRKLRGQRDLGGTTSLLGPWGGSSRLRGRWPRRGGRDGRLWLRQGWARAFVPRSGA